ncbi:MAG: VWA domain-containing protein [Thermoanaerobaculia bacterium]
MLQKTSWNAAISTAVLATCVSIPPAFAQQEAVEDSMVFFLSPRPNVPQFGEIEIEVEALYETVLEVVVSVDGIETVRLSRSPYKATVDLGESFNSRRFVAVAYGPDGELGRAVRVTPGIAVDDAIDLELQQLYVSIESRDETAVRLKAGAFEVRDLGSLQRIVTFEGGDAALTVAVLIDSSESMAGGRLEAALAGAGAFFEGMRELDEASVFLFSDVLRWRTPFSQNPLELRESLAAVTSRGGSAINDTLYRGLRELELRQGRRVIILLSDGVDIHSLLDIEQVTWAARRSRSVIYWIELREGISSGLVTSHWRNYEAHSVEIEGLRRLVAETGGRIVPIAGPERAAEAFGSILEELRAQYVLGYYPSINLDDGRWHRVRVKVDRPGLKVRTRGGYVDY